MKPPVSYPGRTVTDIYVSSGATDESLQDNLRKPFRPKQRFKEIQIAAFRRARLPKATSYAYPQGNDQLETRIPPIGKDVEIYLKYRFPIQPEITRETELRRLSQLESLRPGPDNLGAYIHAVVPSSPDAGAGQESMPEERLASLLGRVESFALGEVIVSLLNEKTRDRLEAECDPESLNAAGIREGDEFRCEVVRTIAGAMVRFMRLEPKQVSKDRVFQIRQGLQDIAI
ncbi:MAG: hypothetical protein L0Z50_27370 [Verrucomicrobiales bacterium]|nr:hypothetical protein [Verrucomicrobiales bacterium]